MTDNPSESLLRMCVQYRHIAFVIHETGRPILSVAVGREKSYFSFIGGIYSSAHMIRIKSRL